MDLEYLTESTCLLYAELLQQCCRAAPSGQGISFVRKKRRDKTYWYIQCSIGNKKSQYYLGPDSPELRDKIAAEKQLWKTVLPELKKRQKLVAMLNAGGVYTVTANEARVLLLMERIGVFLAGGVLVGSHAFKLYENMLGVRWEAQAVKTFDIDVADDNRRLAIGMTNKPVNLGEALLQSNMGFFEVPALDRKHPSSSFFVRGQQLQVDVLTPMPKNKPPSSKPIYLNSLNTPATPLIFLDFVLEDVQPAVVAAQAGILVNVPAPARYALHKLVISRRRPAALQTKAKKDILQAQQLLSVLLADRPGDVELAFEAAQAQPKKFRQQLREGIQQLDERLQNQI